jgi:hypothetical protein
MRQRVDRLDKSINSRIQLQFFNRIYAELKFLCVKWITEDCEGFFS